jgi:ribosomal subunit interface protein
MELVVKGRGVHVTDRMRQVAEHKLSKIERIDPRVERIKLEIIEEHNPRINGNHRVEVAAEAGRNVFRARGEGDDVETALDQATARLERQIADFRGRVRQRHRSGPATPPPA